MEEARIGPNAILQLIPVLDDFGGAAWRNRVIARAGLEAIPDGHQMIPQSHAARVHQRLRREEPLHAPRLAQEAGRRTGDYILAHRIPTFAQRILRVLPAGPSARILSTAIAKHAWTFAGSGRFEVLDPWHFQIAANPLIDGEFSVGCLCHWHAAVFERLYQVLVTPHATCVETQCGAQAPGQPCQFTLTRGARDHLRLYKRASVF